VAEAAAIGLPDRVKGEVIKCSEALQAALVDHVRRELGPIATPSRD
jgi:acetyl-CoA synthetase